jgi:hypothetical protein
MTDNNIERTLGRIEGSVNSFDKRLDAIASSVFTQMNAHEARDKIVHEEIKTALADRCETINDNIRQLGLRVVDLEHHDDQRTGSIVTSDKTWKAAGVVVPSILGGGGIVGIIMGFFHK